MAELEQEVVQLQKGLLPLLVFFVVFVVFFPLAHNLFCTSDKGSLPPGSRGVTRLSRERIVPVTVSEARIADSRNKLNTAGCMFWL